MTTATTVCSVCRTRFTPRFRYQSTPSGIDGPARHYCSQRCRIPELRGITTPSSQPKLRSCATCGEQFAPKFAYQLVTIRQLRHDVCSQLCRSALLTPAAKPGRIPRAIAVLNQKGGTAKTTTSVSVAAGLAEAGHRTLLIDLDAQGDVGVSLGVRGPRSIYHVLIEGLAPEDAAVPIRKNLEVITSDQSLAAAEIELVSHHDRSRVLRRRAAGLVSPNSPYDYIILDCAPSLSILNQNALTFAREVLVPVSCDYLSLVGVKQVLSTLRHVNDVLRHPVSVLGVVPTFYDVRNRISKDAVTALRSYFKDRVLPPVRVNARLKEAPSRKQTIFEYAPDSHGAADYLAVVEWLLQTDTRVEPATSEVTVAAAAR